ncbi:MAG: HTTM domain-containing protein [Myxococcota bacterium]
MMRLWRWWVARCSAMTDPLPLALTRVLVCATIVLDLLRGWALGLSPWLWRTFDDGGLSTFQGERAFIDDLDPAHGGLVTMWIVIGALTSAALGVATRPMMGVGLVAYAQLGHLYPPGDRAIDRLLRTVLLILLFSGAHQRLSLVRWWKQAAPIAQIRRWPVDLIVFILVLVYTSAGLHKVFSTLGWIGPIGLPPVYRIVTDPMVGYLQPDRWAWAMPLFRLGGMFTILIECSAFLLWTRWKPYWALGGAALHLGIAMTMVLGMFSWGMLALYPLLFAPWIVDRFGRNTASTM